MENKAHALMAGLFTIALLTAAIMVGMWLNRDRTEMIPYEMATKLSIPGLNQQAAVRYRGLDVGKVDQISFDPNVPGQILVHFKVKPDTPITQSTYGTLGYQGVTGIAYVQLDDDGSKPIKVHSTDRNTARIEMRPSLFDSLQTRGMEILAQTEELTRRFNILLAPKNQKLILSAFDNVSKAALEIEKIPVQLAPTFAKLPALADEGQRALAALAALSRDATAFTHKLQAPDGALVKFNNAADRVSAVSDNFDLATASLTNDARGTMRAMNRTLDTFNDQPQSLLFGSRKIAPGPGETGFVAPAAASAK